MGTPGSLTKETRKKMPPRGPGRLTKTVKETVLAVFNDLQNDPKTDLTSFAKRFPRDFYTIAAKLIPTELTGKIDNHIKLHIVRGKPNTERTSSGADRSIDES